MLRKQHTLLLALLLAAHAVAAASGLEIIGSAYRADIPFPQFLHLWSEGWSLKDRNGEPIQYASTNMPLGAYVHVYVRNDSPQRILIDDVEFAGISLRDAIAFADREVDKMLPASIRFSKLPKTAIDRLVAVGEPVWWKAEPASVPAGGFCEVTIRLRRQTPGPLDVQMRSATTRTGTAVAAAPSPRFTGLSFSPTLDTVFGYVQPPQKYATAPTKVLLDGQDVTRLTMLASDPAVSVMPLVIRLPKKLERASFHCFEAGFGDGTKALAAIRVWGDEPVYGMWGYSKRGSTPQERVDYYLQDLHRHNVNAVMESYGAEVGEYLSGAAGVKHSQAIDIRAMRNQPGSVVNPVYYFLTDEPDAHDYAVSQLPAHQRLGTLAQGLVRRREEFRHEDPAPPHMLNLDNTYKPENWYMYAQLPDVCCADPYYQEQQNIVWNERPIWASSFIRPLYVLGAATICNSACAPKPLHIILNCVQHKTKGGNFRFATPPEKTVELFYALGAGTKSFSYWWYTPYGEYYGCGASDQEAVELWRQIGLLGAQARTLGPVLTRSCPATLPVQAPARLWTRILLAGTDTLVLLAVNDNIANDRLGTVVVPLAQTPVKMAKPSWMRVTDGFEITPQGLQDLTWSTQDKEISVDLGKTEVARMVVLTADQFLRGELDKLYRTRFAANVAKLTAK